MVAVSLLGCSHESRTDQTEEVQVKAAFAQFKSAVFGAHAAIALRYVDQASRDYLQDAAQGSPDPSAPDAEVKALLHQGILKLTPGGMGPGFTIATPLQRILDQGWMNTHALDSIALGPVTVTGEKARAEALWQGTHTTYELTFVKEQGAWKVDLLGVLPYVEVGLRMGRALRNETEAHQVDRLVSLLPAR
jgi:hypothetical protein